MPLLNNAQNGGFLWAGTGNPADGFLTVGSDTLQLGLTARPTGVGVAYDSNMYDGVVHFDAGEAGSGIRFLYSVASTDYTLDQFVIKLKMDLNPTSVENFKTFILTANQSGPGYSWVWDVNDDGVLDASELAGLGVTAGGYIADDGGALAPSAVTQNIENLAWFDNVEGSSLAGGSYSIVLTAENKLGSNLLDAPLSQKIVLDVAGGGALIAGETAVDLIAVAQNDGNLWAGTGNPAAGFITKEATYVDKTLQLGLTARQTGTGTAYESAVVGDSTRFIVDQAGTGIRFAYSIATDGASLADFDIKLKMDMDAGLGTSFKTFILTEAASTAGNNPSQFAWVLDANNDGKIDASEFAALTNKTAGAYISDDQGHGSQVSQNIMNLGWFDDDLSSGHLQIGTYNIVLEASEKGAGGEPVISNTIVLEVGGGARFAYTPPVIANPTPGAFNDGQTAASVAAFVMGVAPTVEKQADLAAFAQLQYDAYAAKGVSDPLVGAYEALGRSFAETTEFADKYAALSEADFITQTYLEVFGRGPLLVQQGHFQAQIDYFEGIYELAGIDAGQAEIFAKGAILGQMLGHASEGLLV